MTRTTDAVIVGGGVMGCAIALRLAEAGVKTIILEKAIPGAEASSAAGGILAAQEESHGPGPMFDLSLASRSMFPKLAAELADKTGIDIVHRETGLVSIVYDDAAARALEARFAWQRAAGHKVNWLDAADLHAREPNLSDRARRGLHFPDDGQLEPRPYTRALHLAAVRAGAQILEGSIVRRVIHDQQKGGRAIGVELLDERVLAQHVILAAGAWSSLVEGSGRPPRAVRPIRGQIAQLEPRTPIIRGTIISPKGGYLVGRADGRVLAGSTMEHAGFDKVVTAGGLAHVLAIAIDLAPELANAPVTSTWANFRPATEDERPLLGEGTTPGLVYATGHFRNGILLSPITAEIIRDVVTGRPPSRDLTAFSPRRLPLAAP
jgi:glycine oxidase